MAKQRLQQHQMKQFWKGSGSSLIDNKNDPQQFKQQHYQYHGPVTMKTGRKLPTIFSSSSTSQSAYFWQLDLDQLRRLVKSLSLEDAAIKIGSGEPDIYPNQLLQTCQQQQQQQPLEVKSDICGPHLSTQASLSSNSSAGCGPCSDPTSSSVGNVIITKEPRSSPSVNVSKVIDQDEEDIELISFLCRRYIKEQKDVDEEQEQEDLIDYKLGGYHPLKIFDVLNGRY
ncbi:hypothetical protein BLA29_007999, partial [Euroglyphus maynei]